MSHEWPINYKTFWKAGKYPRKSPFMLLQGCGVSLGTIKHCVKALIEKVYVRARGIKNLEKWNLEPCLTLRA